MSGKDGLGRSIAVRRRSGAISSSFRLTSRTKRSIRRGMKSSSASSCAAVKQRLSSISTLSRQSIRMSFTGWSICIASTHTERLVYLTSKPRRAGQDPRYRSNA
jgi:hypothetical protein